jgi:hypothetical protein
MLKKEDKIMKKSTIELNRVSLCLALIFFYLGLPFWITHWDFLLSFLKNIEIIRFEYIKIILYFIYFVFLFVLSFSCLKQFNFYRLKVFCLGINKVQKELNKIKKEDKDENEIWKDIVLNIESTHHSSILSKIKNLDTETKINLPKYNSKYDFTTVFIHKIREFIVLFEIILEKLNHKDILDSNTEKYKIFIQKKLNQLYSLKYFFRANLILSKLTTYFISFLLVLFVIYFLSKVGVLNNTEENPLASSYLNFFLGLGILIFSIPSLLMFSNYIKTFKLWIINKLKVSFSKNLMLQTSLQIILVAIITILMIKGFSLLEDRTSVTSEFKDLFVFFKDMVFGVEFPNTNFNKIFSQVEIKNIENYILLTKVIIGVMGTVILFDIVNNYLKGYDQFFYEQKIKRYLLPPELLKVVASFLIMMMSLIYLYYMITAYPYSNSKNNQVDENKTKAFSIKNDINETDKKNIYIVPIHEEIQSLTKAVKEHKSLEDLLPFGIFIALIGTLLGVAGRDLMANYFTGLSMKMDIPYEIGDRVKIDNSEILEVRNIGLRNDKFYEISSNSIISIPHSKLASNSIKNYTYPTLDYRSELSIYVKNNLKRLEKTPREAEKVLLVSAFINTGVKLPKISTNITDKLKSIDIGKELLKEYNDKKYSIIEEKLLEKNSGLKNKIEGIWEKLKEIDNNEDKTKYKSSFFKNLFIEKLPIDISTNQAENLYIKKVIIAIVNSVIEYQNLIDKYFFSKSDKYGVRRKYNVFNNLEEKKLKEIEKFADVLVDISFYYYMLANRLWELKDKQTSFAQKRKIDNSMIQILNVPRVSSIQKFNDNLNVWKVTLFVTLELSEQSDETLHHINMYIDEIWDVFLQEESSKDSTC